MINQYTMNEIEFGFKLKANLFGGSDEEEYNSKLAEFKENLKKIDEKEEENKQFGSLYSYLSKDLMHPEKIIARGHLLLDDLPDLLDKIESGFLSSQKPIDESSRKKVAEILDIVLPKKRKVHQYENIKKLQNLCNKWLHNEIFQEPEYPHKRDIRKQINEAEKFLIKEVATELEGDNHEILEMLTHIKDKVPEID